MIQSETKYTSVENAVERIPDGALLALGGNEAGRQPMALVRELIRQQKRNLHLASYRYGVDLDMLVRAGCAAKIDTSSNGADETGSSQAFTQPIIEVERMTLDQEAAFARFSAAASDLPYALVKSSSQYGENAGVTTIQDVFGKEPVTVVRRMDPDFVIIHAHAADIDGNVQMDVETHADFARDIVLARAAKYVIVSVEQIVSPQTIATAPWKTVLPAQIVDCIVEAPYGAHPFACVGRYGADQQGKNEYAKMVKSDDAHQWFIANIYDVQDHKAYLNSLGLKRLQGVTTKRSAYS